MLCTRTDPPPLPTARTFPTRSNETYELKVTGPLQVSRTPIATPLPGSGVSSLLLPAILDLCFSSLTHRTILFILFVELTPMASLMVFAQVRRFRSEQLWLINSPGCIQPLFSLYSAFIQPWSNFDQPLLHRCLSLAGALSNLVDTWFKPWPSLIKCTIHPSSSVDQRSMIHRCFQSR